MAKKKTTKKTVVKKTAKKGVRSAVDKKRDAATINKIESLASSVVKRSLAQKEPTFEIPTRSISNMTYNKKKRILEMGSNTQTRSLFNLGQSRKFMQSLLLAKGCRDLIDAEKTLSLRGMYYMGLHTIPGTKEKTFNDQGESDGILEDLEVSLDGLREELHVFAKKRGTMVGNITVVDNGDEINCRQMGSGGYAIPSICEPNVMQFKSCEADFYHSQCDQDGVVMRMQLPQHPVITTIDASLLKQAILNLLINASHAMAESDQKELMIRLEVVNNEARIHIIDTGKGIEEERFDKIFHPYVSSKRGGTGLGLPTTMRIAQEHGGHITVNSTVGQGSDFIVGIPLHSS